MTVINNQKFCPHCERMLPVTSFWKFSKKPDGLQGWCKTCLNNHHREVTYARNSKTKEYKKYQRVHQKIYVSRHPEKVKAHKLARANKDSLLKSACEECGGTEKLHMHHPDYSKPLEVVTLCIPCHEIAHHGVPV